MNQGRRPIVLVTDGIDTSSAVQAPVAARAIREQFMIYGIGLEGKGLSTRLVDLIGQTGGGHFDLKRSDDLGAAFLRLADELHNQVPDRIHATRSRWATAFARGPREARGFPSARANAVRRAGEEMNSAVVRLIATLIAAGIAGSVQRVAMVTVTYDVAVLDPGGSPIAGLRVEDFEALVAGEPVAITRASTASADLSIILIVDATNSQPLKRYEINNALASQWLPGLNAGDRVRVGVLATPLTLSAWLPSDPRVSAGLVRPLIERAGPEPSPLWDATHVAIEALAGEKAPENSRDPERRTIECECPWAGRCGRPGTDRRRRDQRRQ